MKNINQEAKPRAIGNIMIKKLLHYILGAILFITYSCGVLLLAYFFIKNITDNFGRHGFEDEEDYFLLCLIVVLATALVVLIGNFFISYKLSKNGNKDVAHGMLVGVAVFIIYTKVNIGIQDWKQRREEAGSLAQIEQSNLEDKCLQDQNEETRTQLIDTDQEQVTGADSVSGNLKYPEGQN